MASKPKVVILLAGMGSRLGRPYPKSLVQLDSGDSILSRALGIFDNMGLEVCAVVGFKKDLIMEVARDAMFAYNANYDTTNTSKSLLCALRHFENQDVLWLNGDVVFEKEIVEKIISQGESCVAVNNARTSDEEVKYTLNDDGFINAISKEVKGALGEALGINFIKAEHLEDFKKKLEVVEDQDYFEKGMELLIQENGNVFKALDVGELSCIEVDFAEDLAAAKELFQ